MNMFADDELLDSQQDLFPSQASTPFSQRSTQPPSPIIINLCSDIEDDPVYIKLFNDIYIFFK